MTKPISLIDFSRARVEQYAERKGLSLQEARTRIFRIYGHQCDQDAVAAEIDPVVDEALRWHNRPGATPVTP